ncbi:MAG TPA: UvrD-helicase domain-containing protein, partial [Actinomycetota bacterium]|nr:UvrD-helicase domain-containing protein [Actinomycetota bacterium]
SGFEVTAIDEPEVARIKGDSRMAVVTKNAVAGLSRPLVQPETLKLDETSPLRLDGFRLTITPADSRAMVSLVSKLPGPHNENRPEMEDLVVDHLMRQWVREWQARTGDDTGSYPRAAFKRELLSGSDFGRVVDLMWPVMTPGRLVSGLLSGESALSASQEVLSDRERELLRREEHRGWTVHDAPLLDEAAVLLGTVPGARSRRKPERESDEWAAEEMVEDLASAASFRGSPDAPGMMDPLMRREVAQRMVDRMRDEEWEPPDRERETFGHVLVDEAQDLSPMQWRMIQRRCPSRSMTLLGDLAQAGGPLQPQTWHEVAGWAGSGPASEVELTINYRTPAQIMAVAERVLSATQPGVRPPRAVRETGFEPVFLAAQDAAEEAVRVAREEQSEVGDGTVAVIAPVGMARNIASAIGPSETISVLTADEAKGLEFDSVVVVEPARIAVTSSGGLRSLYVALTRPTQRLTVVHAEPLPPTLAAS